MNVTLHYIVPFLLLIGAFWLGLQEAVAFRRASVRPWVRLFRRWCGAIILVIIAYMLYKGDTTLILMSKEEARRLAESNREYVSGCLNYWTTVMGLVCATVVLALWDVVDSLKRIKRMLHESAVDDLKAFTELIEKRGQGNLSSHLSDLQLAASTLAANGQDGQLQKPGSPETDTGKKKATKDPEQLNPIPDDTKPVEDSTPERVTELSSHSQPTETE